MVQLSWWPVTRDSMMYGVAVIALITVLIDGKVMWYEAAILVSAYVLYIAGKAEKSCCFKTSAQLEILTTNLSKVQRTMHLLLGMRVIFRGRVLS